MASNKIRKSLLWILSSILLAGAVIWLVLQHRSLRPAIGHVVLISLDTCRADHLSCYGYSQPTTPHIDALASEGYLFSHAMTPVPLTLPAHTSMLTGTVPPYHGKHENQDVYFDPSHVTLAALLKTKGYRTGAFVGAQVLNNCFGLNRGFDTYNDKFAKNAQGKDPSQRRAEEVNSAAFKWLEKQKDSPVFLFLHYYDPHTTYDPPEPFATTYKENLYAGEIAYVDHCIGQVVAKLKSLDMYESSLIIVTGDHGEMLGEHGEITHKYFIYQSAIKVPLIYKLPGSTEGQRIDDLASIIDIVPTVCDLVGIKPPSPIHGKSLAGYFTNKQPPPQDRSLYCESFYSTQYDTSPLLGMVTNQWKYIQTTRPELYDLQKDPGEQTNLVDLHPQRARILKDRLSQTLEQTVRQKGPQAETPLDPRTINHLRSLGYIAISTAEENFSFDQSKEDPKDLIGFHNEFHKIHDLMRENKFADMRTLGESLIKQRPQFHKTYDLLLGAALNQNDHDAAIRYGKKALALKPGRFNEHFLLAMAYSQAKQYDHSVRHFELVLKFIPKDQAYYLTPRANVHNLLARLHLAQKKFDLAIVHFEDSLKLNPKQPEILDTFAWALLDCPDLAIRNPHRALELAQKACWLTQSKHPDYLNTMAVAHSRCDNLREAIRISEKALALAQSKGDQKRVTNLQKQLDLFKKSLKDQN